MSNVVIFGGTGYAGSRIAAELRKRGHSVTSVTRSGGDGSKTGDVTDRGQVGQLLEGADVAILAIRAYADGQKPLADAIANIVASGSSARLAVVGGAASLRTKEDGPLVFDLPTFPELYKNEAAAQGEALEQLRGLDSETDWFYVSPTGTFGSHAPQLAPRGTYRTQLDTLVVDEDGTSHIAGEDYALAFVDEIETPAHSRQRFAVGY